MQFYRLQRFIEMIIKIQTFIFVVGTSVLVDDYEDDTDEIFGLSRNNNNNGKSLTPPNFINNDDDVDPLMQTACDDEEVHLRCLSDEYVDVSFKNTFENG